MVKTCANTRMNVIIVALLAPYAHGVMGNLTAEEISRANRKAGKTRGGAKARARGAVRKRRNQAR